MRSISFSGFESVNRLSAIHNSSFDALVKRLEDAKSDFSYKTPFHFVSFLEDYTLKARLKSIKREKDTPELSIVFVVGIGGANLGAKAIIEALPKKEGDREFVFLDTLYGGEEDELRAIVSKLKNKNEFVIVLVSKSGKTIETLANAKLLTALLEERHGNISDRMIVVTSDGSPLSIWAKHEEISCVTISDQISERYSLFSPVTIVPLLFSGISLDDLYEGGKEALSIHIKQLNSSMSPALSVASALEHHIKQNFPYILDLFFFGKELESVGKWHRQLLAESLGKSETVKGLPSKFSLTPTVSIGTTDLHSSLQLYLSQPTGRISWFFAVESDQKNTISTSQSLRTLLPKLSEETPEHVLKLIYESILETYHQNGIPYIESTLKSVSEYNLGFHMMNAMLMVTALANLWDINAFDQPHVEGYKTLVSKAL